MPTSFSHIHHEYIHLSLQHKFFTMPILPKFKPKFIQQHHNLPTLSKFHKPPTLPKLHHEKKNTLQECSKANILQHNQSCNAPKLQQQNDNVSPWNFQWNMQQHFFQAKKPKKKLTLVSTWQYGAWVLGSWRSPSSSSRSNVRSYFLPWKERKEDPLEEEAILIQRKMDVENGFHQKWVCAENAQNTRI